MNKLWSASNYAARKAARLALTKPEWITVPSGERFYLRKVGSLISVMIAGNMPSSLTDKAVAAWKEQGVEGLDDLSAFAAQMTPEQREAGVRETKRLTGIVQQSCIIPLLSNDSPEAIVFTDEWTTLAIAGLKELDKEFDESTFDPKSLVLDPRDLDDKDAEWLLYTWGTGLHGTVGMKGGEAMQVDDLARFRKKAARGSRVGRHGPKVRKAS